MDSFDELVEPYRRELMVHCYRILGSVQDAEDVLQETLVAAWRGLGAFEGRASVRTWLYRIATNRCLNALRDGARRPRTVPALPPVDPFPTPTRVGEPVWLQPYPDALGAVADPAPGPEARYESREAISLAFVTAVQLLTPRQRAVLVLRDVLGFRAAEVASMLGISADAVTSALRRARSALPVPSAPSIPDRGAADRFASALEDGDVAAMVALLSDDALLTMPPVPLEYVGAEVIGDFMRRVALRDGTRAYRSVRTWANGQPAYGMYVSDHGDPVFSGHGLMVLSVAGARVTGVVRFVDPGVMPYFDLPPSL